MTQVLLEAGAEDEEGRLGFVEAGEVLEFGDLRVNLLGEEDSPGALWSDTCPQYLHPVRPDMLHPQSLALAQVKLQARLWPGKELADAIQRVGEPREDVGVIQIRHDDEIVTEVGLEGFDDGTIGHREEEGAKWVALADAFGRVEEEGSTGDDEGSSIVVGPFGAPIETGCVFAETLGVIDVHTYCYEIQVFLSS